MIDKSFDLNKLRLRHYPDPVLKQVAGPVDQINSQIASLADRMAEIMLEAVGIGLAGTQVGVPLRIITICPTGKPEDVETLINPKLSNFEGWSEIEEGCLSLPGIRAKVRRPTRCRLTAVDLQGHEIVIDAAELLAVVFQHEIDHLDGTLFIDRLSPISRMAVRNSIKQLENDNKE